MIGDDTPIDTFPPTFEEVAFTGDAVIDQPDVWPDIDTQEGDDGETTWGGGGALAGITRTPVLDGGLTGDVGGGMGAGVDDVLIGHVDGLQAIVRSRKGRAGQVGGQDPVTLPLIGMPDEPDEARAEHAIGRHYHLVP